MPQLDALVKVGVRGETGGDNGAQVLEFGAEMDEATAEVDEERGGVRVLVRLARPGEDHGFSLGLGSASETINFQRTIKIF